MKRSQCLEKCGPRRLAVALALLFSSLAGPAAAQTTAPRPVSLEAANRAYGEGRFADAAADFERLIAQHGYSEPLLFDLGNAYLKAGKPVRAILAYERARLLAPGDDALAANLRKARAAASAPDERSAVARGADALSMDGWSWLASGGFFLALFSGALVALAKRGRRLAAAAAACGVVIFVTSVGGLFLQARRLDHGLVLESAPVLVSPFESAQSDFELSAGSEVELVRTRDRFALIRDGRGRSGWVERTRLAPLLPRAG